MPYRGSYEAKRTNSGKSPWLGFQDVALTDFVNKSDQYENLDVYIEVHFRNENSQFPTKYNLLGSFDYESDGTISGDSSLLKKILYLTDALGWDGGINTKGEWVDGDDNVLEDDVALTLNAHFTQANYGIDNHDTPYYIFVYSKWDDKAKRAYPTVCPKVVKNDEKGRTDLESYINFMKAKKYIVEHDVNEKVVNSVSPRSTTASGGTQTSF
jgi:hypothetical protein